MYFLIVQDVSSLYTKQLLELAETVSLDIAGTDLGIQLMFDWSGMNYQRLCLNRGHPNWQDIIIQEMKG